MELQGLRETPGAPDPGDGHQPEHPKPGNGVWPAMSFRGKFFLLIICTFIGLSILLSIVSLGTAVGLMTRLLGEMKTSDAGFRMELAQVKSDVIQLLNETKASDSSVMVAISNLKGSVTRLISEMNTSDTDLKMDLARYFDNVTQLLIETKTSSDNMGRLVRAMGMMVQGCCRTGIVLRPEPCPLIPPRIPDPILLVDQWIRFNQTSYYFSSTRGTWNESQTFCASMNSNLVVINSLGELEFLARNQIFDSWIGLNDRRKEGIWRWVDGTDYESNVKFWGIGQPQGSGWLEEDCAVLSERGTWHDWPCRSIHHLICESPFTMMSQSMTPGD